jgi:hypothetical protein
VENRNRRHNSNKVARVPTILDKMETRKSTTVTKVLQRVLGVLFGSPRGTTVDLEVGLIMCPEIPVGGCLNKFLPNWEKIATDQWVLSIIKEGYKLEFFQKPSWTGIKKTIISQKNVDIFMQEINILIEKDVIEKVYIIRNL